MKVCAEHEGLSRDMTDMYFTVVIRACFQLSICQSQCKAGDKMDNIIISIASAIYELKEQSQCKASNKLDLMFMKHYAPNRCLYIKVAKLGTGVGIAEPSYLQNCSVKLFKEHFKVQIFKGR